MKLLQVYQEFQILLTDLSVENLLEQFTLAKHTGLEKPGRWERFIFNKSLQYSPLNRRPSRKLAITTTCSGGSGSMAAAAGKTTIMCQYMAVLGGDG
jgi:hypothetical protein